MDCVALIVGISWALGGVLCMAAAVPLARGRVGPNYFYGARFPESFNSRDAWYAINRFAGRRLIVWSVPMIAAGVVALFLPLKAHPGLAVVVGFAPLAFVLIPAFESWRFARRYTEGNPPEASTATSPRR
jgi:uncharacterized membrane protein